MTTERHTTSADTQADDPEGAGIFSRGSAQAKERLARSFLWKREDPSAGDARRVIQESWGYLSGWAAADGQQVLESEVLVETRDRVVVAGPTIGLVFDGSPWRKDPNATIRVSVAVAADTQPGHDGDRVQDVRFMLFGHRDLGGDQGLADSQTRRANRERATVGFSTAAGEHRLFRSVTIDPRANRISFDDEHLFEMTACGLDGVLAFAGRHADQADVPVVVALELWVLPTTARAQPTGGRYRIAIDVL